MLKLIIIKGWHNIEKDTSESLGEYIKIYDSEQRKKCTSVPVFWTKVEIKNWNKKENLRKIIDGKIWRL